MHDKGEALPAVRMSMLTRSLAAFTLLGLSSGAAHAQSSVTLYLSLIHI